MPPTGLATATPLSILEHAIDALEDLSREQRTTLLQLAHARTRTRRPLGLRDFKTSARRAELDLPDYWDVRSQFGSLTEALGLLSRIP